MKIRTHRQALVSLESVAITDIILNMFIFFFTSFSLVFTFNPARESHIQIQLPQAEVQQEALKREPIIVNINSKGEVHLGNTLTPLPRLTAAMRQALGGDPQTPVIVRSDKRVVIDLVVKVIEAVNKAEAWQLSIAVEERKGD
jgi:biopolymer transport protein ExbD